jgi:hypothetical protein
MKIEEGMVLEVHGKNYLVKKITGKEVEMIDLESFDICTLVKDELNDAKHNEIELSKQMAVLLANLSNIFDALDELNYIASALSEYNELVAFSSKNLGGDYGYITAIILQKMEKVVKQGFSNLHNAKDNSEIIIKTVASKSLTTAKI